MLFLYMCLYHYQVILICLKECLILYVQFLVFAETENAIAKLIFLITK